MSTNNTTIPNTGGKITVVHEFTLPPNVQASITTLKPNAIARLLKCPVTSVFLCDMYTNICKAINMKFNCRASSECFIDAVNLEVLRQTTHDMWTNLGDGQQFPQLNEPLLLAVQKLDNKYPIGYQLENSTLLTTDDFKTIQSILLAAVAPATKVEEEKKDSDPLCYSKEVYDDLTTKVSKQGYYRLIRLLYGYESRNSWWSEAKKRVLEHKSFLTQKGLDTMVEAIRLEVMRTELGQKWQALETETLENMRKVGGSTFWDSDSLTAEHVVQNWTKLVAKKEEKETKFYASKETLEKFSSLTYERMQTILESIGIKVERYLGHSDKHYTNLLECHAFSSAEELHKLDDCVHKQKLRSEISHHWNRLAKEHRLAYITKIVHDFPILKDEKHNKLVENPLLDNAALFALLTLVQGPVPKPERTIAQRIVSLVQIVDSGTTKAYFLVGMIAGTRVTNYKATALWKLNNNPSVEFLKALEDAMSEDETRGLAAQYVKELLRRTWDHETVAYLVGREGFRDFGLYHTLGADFTSLSDKQRTVVIEYLRSCPLEEK